MVTCVIKCSHTHIKHLEAPRTAYPPVQDTVNELAIFLFRAALLRFRRHTPARLDSLSSYDSIETNQLRFIHTLLLGVRYSKIIIGAVL